jgi:hypothetical protein
VGDDQPLECTNFHIVGNLARKTIPDIYSSPFYEGSGHFCFGDRQPQLICIASWVPMDFPIFGIE